MHVHRPRLGRTIKIHGFHTHKPVPCLASSKKLPHAANGNRYREPQPDNTQRARDLGTLNPKQKVSIKSLTSELRELCRRGSGKNVRAREGRGQPENKAI